MVDSHYRIGYVAINRFLHQSAPENGFDMQTATALQVRQEMVALAESGMRALILDLRGNGGGQVLAAVEIADSLLDGGSSTEPRLIVAQTSRHPEHQRRYTAQNAHTLPRWPLVVLIDRFTASSGEILAAALRDHGRAVLIGEKSHGKESVQQLFLLNDGGALLLTVAQFQTPAVATYANMGYNLTSWYRKMICFVGPVSKRVENIMSIRLLTTTALCSEQETLYAASFY